MPRFEDTPNWKTRQAHEHAMRSTAASGRQLATSVSYPACGVARGWPCRGDSGPHPERVSKARGVMRSRRRRAARIRVAQANRWDSVTVRFECPMCGGDHSRADHEKALDTLGNRASRNYPGGG